MGFLVGCCPAIAETATPTIARLNDWEVVCDGAPNAATSVENEAAKSSPPLARQADAPPTAGAPSAPAAAPTAQTAPTKPEVTASRLCRAAQHLIVKGTDAIVFAMSVLPAGKDRTLIGIVSVPLGGYLAPGLEMSIDKGKPYKILYETCNGSGCHAGFPINGRLRRELAAGSQALFRVWTTKAQSSDIKISLNGLGKAFDMLAKERP